MGDLADLGSTCRGEVFLVAVQLVLSQNRPIPPILDEGKYISCCRGPQGLPLILWYILSFSPLNGYLVWPTGQFAASGGRYGEEAVGHVAQPTEGSAGSCPKLVEDRMMP